MGRGATSGKVFVQMFDAALASWVGAPASMCIFSETCGNALALEHNGDLYSCDHFVEPKHLLGNIQQVHMLQLVTSEQQRQFGLAKRDTLPKYCRECSVRFACHGECPEEPLHHDAGRRARAELPVRRLHGVLHSTSIARCA